MSESVDIKLPKDIQVLSGLSKEELEKLNQLVLSIELYLDEKISIGKAAEVSGLSFDEFHDELIKRNIKRKGYVSSTEIDKEIQNIKKHFK
ncbi:MAG: hypothetical protein HeimC3_48100 [Candidatus Heimdallarchaeota archaeon LC_3]|nr:MAG: hypothetical protein HeimC3_48100 [Candidatus Heimdallarchaeota archaeon LC_3]